MVADERRRDCWGAKQSFLLFYLFILYWLVLSLILGIFDFWIVYSFCWIFGLGISLAEV